MIRDSIYTAFRPLNRRLLVRGVVILVCIGAVASLMGWAFGIAALRSLIPGAVQMKVNTGLALLLSGVSLSILSGTPTRLAARSVALLTCIVAGIGAASLAEYLFGWRLGIDELLIKDNADAYNAVPGRMSPMSAVAFIALSAALASMLFSSLRGLTIAAASTVLAIGCLSILGYLWHAGEIITDRWLPPVALNSAVCFVLLAGAILSSPIAQ